MFEELSDATFQARIAEVKAGACIFYKQLCPHCKNMEKVLEKFSKLQPDAVLLSIDIEQNPVSAQALRRGTCPHYSRHPRRQGGRKEGRTHESARNGAVL